MPAEVVKCVVCGQKVSKRSTLSLNELGGGNGRACRTHDVVQDLLKGKERELKERKERELEVKRAWAEADRIMRIVSGIAIVQFLATFQGVPAEVIYSCLRLKGYPEDVIDDIKKEVAKRGGPQMKPDEIVASLAMAAVLKQKDDELIRKN